VFPEAGPESGPHVAYPPSVPRPAGPRQELCVLHLDGPRFGGPAQAGGPVDRLARLRAAFDAAAHLPEPELVVVSGSLTESGTLEQFEKAFGFVTGLRSMFGLETGRVVLVPGSGDITAAARRPPPRRRPGRCRTPTRWTGSSARA
jgi:hypothetical protein